ncbi:MAG: universal stress protein [Telluria sp.]
MKIVVAYDDSMQARKALERLSWWPAAALDVLIVTAVPGPALNAFGDAVSRDPEKEAEAVRFQAQALASLRSRAIRAEATICTGEPHDAVLEVAARAQADLIVTGSRGRNLASRVLLGSVSTDILNQAPCPVLLVR